MAQELSSIRSLAGLYQLKYNNVLNIAFTIEDEETLELIDVPPSVCLTLFENALKHSAVGIEEGSHIHVSYKIRNQELLFEIINSISRKKNLVGNMNDSGLGNEAVINILEKNYAGRFTFISEPVESNNYQTILKIKL
jgi:LytS/YehU family sensor histidine kinase